MSGKDKPEKTIAFVVYPGIASLELVGAYAIGQSFLMSRDVTYSITTVSESTDAISMDAPLGLLPGKTFADIPHPDILFVMGGGGLSTLFALESDALVEYVRAAAESASLVIGVSAGTLLLVAAGLLQGRQVTSHWAYTRLLERLGAEYVEKRWVEEGKLITTAGGTGALDMGLDLVARHVGKKVADLQQLMAEYDPEPLFGPVDRTQIDYDALVPALVENREKLQMALQKRPEIMAAVDSWIQATYPGIQGSPASINIKAKNEKKPQDVSVDHQ